MTFVVDPAANGIPWVLGETDADAAPTASTIPIVTPTSNRPRAELARARSFLLNIPCPLLSLVRRAR